MGVAPVNNRVSRLLRRIRASLQGEQGKVPTYMEIETWSDVSESTIKDWINGAGNLTVELLLRLFERLPENIRTDILRRYCREYPTLDHPRLRW
jgi:hypothetical protein